MAGPEKIEQRKKFQVRQGREGKPRPWPTVNLAGSRRLANLEGKGWGEHYKRAMAKLSQSLYDEYVQPVAHQLFGQAQTELDPRVEVLVDRCLDYAERNMPGFLDKLGGRDTVREGLKGQPVAAAQMINAVGQDSGLTSLQIAGMKLFYDPYGENQALGGQVMPNWMRRVNDAIAQSGQTDVAGEVVASLIPGDKLKLLRAMLHMVPNAKSMFDVRKAQLVQDIDRAGLDSYLRGANAQLEGVMEDHRVQNLEQAGAKPEEIQLHRAKRDDANQSALDFFSRMPPQEGLRKQVVDGVNNQGWSTFWETASKGLSTTASPVAMPAFGLAMNLAGMSREAEQLKQMNYNPETGEISDPTLFQNFVRYADPIATAATESAAGLQAYKGVAAAMGKAGGLTMSKWLAWPAAVGMFAWDAYNAQSPEGQARLGETMDRRIIENEVLDSGTWEGAAAKSRRDLGVAARGLFLGDTDELFASIPESPIFRRTSAILQGDNPLAWDKAWEELQQSKLKSFRYQQAYEQEAPRLMRSVSEALPTADPETVHEIVYGPPGAPEYGAAHRQAMISAGQMEPGQQQYSPKQWAEYKRIMGETGDQPLAEQTVRLRQLMGDASYEALTEHMAGRGQSLDQPLRAGAGRDFGDQTTWMSPAGRYERQIAQPEQRRTAIREFNLGQQRERADVAAEGQRIEQENRRAMLADRTRSKAFYDRLSQLQARGNAQHRQMLAQRDQMADRAIAQARGETPTPVDQNVQVADNAQAPNPTMQKALEQLQSQGVVRG